MNFNKYLLPMDKEMTPQMMADICYPYKKNDIGLRGDGKTFNRASATCARIARKTNGMLEIKYNRFIRMY